VGFWGGAVPENLDSLHELAAAGVLGFKCFLADSGNPRFRHLNAEQFATAMAAVADIGSVMLVHAEDHRVIHAGPPAQSTYSSLLRARPEAAEIEAVDMVIDTVRRTGARAHIVHVSSARVLPALAAAKWAGLPVTAETCPHYLTFAANEIADNATEFAVCPPIRRGANRQQLWSGLREGVLDMVVSDHSPCAPALKAGDFGQAFGGISSLELGPRAVWTRASMRGFGLPDLCRWMAQEPAALAGLTDRGRIAVGCRADFALFDPDAHETVSAGTLSHRHPLTPYDGMVLRGRVVQTWLDGRPVDGRTHGALLSAVPTAARKSA
jgi:allantoinase